MRKDGKECVRNLCLVSKCHHVLMLDANNYLKIYILKMDFYVNSFKYIKYF